MVRRAAIAAALAATLLPGAGSAQSSSALLDAVRAGIVGERHDGYMGFAATPSDGVRRQVNAVNIRRRALYTGLAQRRGVTPQMAGAAAGCRLLSALAVGGSYMLSDGVWRRRQAGQAAPTPEHCPGR